MMSRKCAGLKPTPVHAGRLEVRSIGRSRLCLLPAEHEAHAISARLIPAQGLSAQDLIGSSEPVPLGVLMVSQVPFATYFQALPW